MEKIIRILLFFSDVQIRMGALWILDFDFRVILLPTCWLLLLYSLTLSSIKSSLTKNFHFVLFSHFCRIFEINILSSSLVITECGFNPLNIWEEICFVGGIGWDIGPRVDWEICEGDWLSWDSCSVNVEFVVLGVVFVVHKTGSSSSSIK